MQRNNWKERGYKNGEFPVWICPTCHSGTLHLAEKLLTKPTAELQKIPDFYYDKEGNEVSVYLEDIEGIEQRFIGFFKCSSDKCNEYVSASGIIRREVYYYEDEEEGMLSDLKDFYYPLFFDPSLQIIELSELYPQKIQEELTNSFRLFWLDNSACANKIRSVIELLMDSLKTPKRRKTRKGKLINLKLHERIEKFQEKDLETAHFLFTIKWIGNSGSHHLDTINRRQILDAYELLELSLNRIYLKDHQRLRSLSREINKRKKPI